MASYPPEEVAYQLAHADEDQRHDLLAYYIVLVVIIVFCMITRIISRRLSQKGVSCDDYVFLAGAVVALGSYAVLIIYSTSAGLGKHWLTLSDAEKTLFPKLNYAYNLLNLFCYPLIKISILLWYYGVFALPRFRVYIVLAMCVVTSSWISVCIVSICACRPIRSFFDPSVTPEYCVNVTDFYWACAALNVITDVIIIAIPIPIVIHLNISTPRKVGVITLFTLGGLTIIVSIMRIVYYLKFNPLDASYSFIPDAYATAGEVCLGIVVACAATWKPLIKHLVARFFPRYSRVDQRTRLNSDESTMYGLSPNWNRRHSSRTTNDDTLRSPSSVKEDDIKGFSGMMGIAPQSSMEEIVFHGGADDHRPWKPTAPLAPPRSAV